MSPVLDRPRAARTPRPAREAARAVAPEVAWDELEPRGFYAHHGRTVLTASLFAATLVPVAALGTLVGLANLACFRDPRLVFYTQPRVGHRGRVFHIYKFRTMRDAATSAHDSWARGGDGARVTRLGKFLRSTHLDELPQFLNIARGEMTFIGPRPEMLEVEAWASEHVPGFGARLALKPGITGRAQITQGYTGRSVDAYTEKLAINEGYRRELSLRADLEILVRTLVWMARGRGWGWNKTPQARVPATARADAGEVGGDEPRTERDGEHAASRGVKPRPTAEFS